MSKELRPELGEATLPKLTCNINIREDGCVTIKEVNGKFVLQLGADTEVTPQLEFVQRFAEYMGTTTEDACKALIKLRVMARKECSNGL